MSVVFAACLFALGIAVLSNRKSPYDPVATTSLGVRRAIGERFAATLQLRDVIHLCGGDKTFFCPEARTLHHQQWTAGLRFRL